MNYKCYDMRFRVFGFGDLELTAVGRFGTQIASQMIPDLALALFKRKLFKFWPPRSAAVGKLAGEQGQNTRVERMLHDQNRL